jgi:hypothetical protein
MLLVRVPFLFPSFFSCLCFFRRNACKGIPPCRAVQHDRLGLDRRNPSFPQEAPAACVIAVLFGQESWRVLGFAK